MRGRAFGCEPQAPADEDCTPEDGFGARGDEERTLGGEDAQSGTWLLRGGEVSSGAPDAISWGGWGMLGCLG